MGANYVCPECGKEHTSKKSLRACVFSHLEGPENVDEVVSEEVIGEVVEDIPEPEGEYYVHRPIVVKAYKTEIERTIETLNGPVTASSGDWVLTAATGEQWPCKPEVFKKGYDRCDGEFAPVIIPRRLCPTELEYLSVDQALMVRVHGVLTKDFEIEVSSVDFIRR